MAIFSINHLAVRSAPFASIADACPIATGDKVIAVKEMLDQQRETWPDWRDAVLQAHHPRGESDLAPTTPVRRRLAYDELLANQLAIALVRDRQLKQRGRSLRGDGHLRYRSRSLREGGAPQSVQTRFIGQHFNNNQANPCWGC